MSLFPSASLVRFPQVPDNFVPRSVSNLRASIVRRGGPQMASRYIVEFVSPNDLNSTGESFITYPSEVNLPQRALATYTAGQPESLWGTKRKVPVMHEYDEVTMSFVIYEDFAERNFFEKWMDYIINKGSYSSFYQEAARPYSSYVGKIYIGTLAKDADQTDSTQTGKFTSTTVLDEAYPLSLLPISLSADNTGYSTYVVNFAYRKYYNLRVASGGIIDFSSINED
jgi:hypothetical protein